MSFDFKNLYPLFRRPSSYASQYIKMPRKNTVATSTKYSPTNGGRHDTGKLYRSVSAATHRHRKPIALLFVVLIRSSIIRRRRRQQQQQQQQHHNKKYGAASRIADCNTQPTIRAPAPRFDHARNPNLNNISRDIDRGNLETPCCCYCGVGIEMPVDELRWVAFGHVKTILVPACISSINTSHASGAESNRNVPVRATRQLAFSASPLSTLVRCRVSTSQHKGQFCWSPVRCEVCL